MPREQFISFVRYSTVIACATSIFALRRPAQASGPAFSFPAMSLPVPASQCTSRTLYVHARHLDGSLVTDPAIAIIPTRVGICGVTLAQWSAIQLNQASAQRMCHSPQIRARLQDESTMVRASLSNLASSPLYKGSFRGRVTLDCGLDHGAYASAYYNNPDYGKFTVTPESGDWVWTYGGPRGNGTDDVPFTQNGCGMGDQLCYIWNQQPASGSLAWAYVDLYVTISVVSGSPSGYCK